jgi:leader peptidase (prepilin peptidase) / N-methyltransferase
MPLHLLLAAVLVLAVVCDLRARRIPDAVTAPGAVAALALGGHVIAGVAAAGLFGAAALARPDGMGLGDAKLAGVMGLCLGPPVGPALLVACGLATAYGLGVALARGVAAARAVAVPFAPFLAAGSGVAVVAV